jgi:hypothetical protein
MKLVVSVSTPDGKILNWEALDMPISELTTAVQVSLIDTKTKEVSGTVVIPIQVALANIRAKEEADRNKV